MEVHHHPNVEKKNFKEYFLEFLMIFLAVTMGFFAENIRESISKHEQEHQLMSEMVEDLKRDTADIHLHIQITKQKIYSFDTLIDLVFQSRRGELSESALRKMYFLYTQSKGWGPHEPTTRTLNQLDKENGFGFIHKKEISDSILTYKDLNQLSITLSERFRNRQEQAREFAQNIFDYEYLSKDYFFRLNEDSLSNKAMKLKILTQDHNILSIYGAKLIGARIVLKTYLNRLEIKVQCAARLAKNINQKYSLGAE
jgi:hypothetical protein